MLKIRKMMKRQKGFTLVELIVVIAILGILAALAVPRFMNTLETQREKTDLANIRTVQSAYDIYLADNNGEPFETGTLEAALVTDGDYLDEMPEMKSDKFSTGDWDVDSANKALVTYGDQTYSQWAS